MSYKLNWTNPTLNPNKPDEKLEIVVPVSSTVNDKASISFTGKGAPNYGKELQESIMHMLENFADNTPPLYPTVGQLWYNAKTANVMVCESSSPEPVWSMVGQIQLTTTQEFPEDPVLGDILIVTLGPVTYKMFMYSGVGRFPEKIVDGKPVAIGGWEQVFPQVEIIGGREEYDAAYDLVMDLIGPLVGGGNNATESLITNLTDFSLLDASLVEAYNRIGADPYLIQLNPGETPADLLKVDPTSNDWDALLMASKYAVKRLDLPNQTSDNISDMPFVRDGSPVTVPSYVSGVLTNSTNNSTNDYILPSRDRRANRKLGSITMHRKYSETLNTLYNAHEQRYALQGVSGNSGYQPTYWDRNRNGTVVDTLQVTYSTPVNGTPSVFTVDVGFATATDLSSWVNSGGILDFNMTFNNAGQDAASVNLNNLLDLKGTVRITADKTRVLTNAAASKSLSAGIDPQGFHNLAAIGTVVLMSNQVARDCSYTVQGTKKSDTVLTFSISLAVPSPVNGNIYYSVTTVADTMTIASGQRVFSQPSSVTRV